MAFVITKDAEVTWVEFDPQDGTAVERYKLKRLNPFRAQELRKKFPDDLDLTRELFVEVIQDWESVYDGKGKKAAPTADAKRALFDSAGFGDEVALRRVTFLAQCIGNAKTWQKVDVEAVLKNLPGSPNGRRKKSATRKAASNA